MEDVPELLFDDVPQAVVGDGRLVEVAVDAPGGGSKAWTYHLPPDLADVEAGEAVLVPFGRRLALGIVMADAAADAPQGDGVAASPAARRSTVTKAVAERVRADGPLLPPLALRFVRWVAEHYLAPPAMAVRAALPPGMLERLELVAERRPGAVTNPPADVADADVLEQLARGPRAVRSIVASEGRANLLRRLRTLAERDLVTLDWVLSASGAGPRFERWLLPTDDGRAAAAALDRGERPAGRPLGPRQVGALRELAEAPPDGLRAGELGGRHGTPALAGLVRRGLAAVDVRERPRLPLAGRAPGLRGGRPPGTALSGVQAAALAAIVKALHARDPRPTLLDGVTGAGKTAVYVESIAAALELGRPAIVLVPEIALALPLVDRLRSDLDVRVALVHSALGDGERADEWRRIRAGDVDVVVGTRLAITSPLADVGLIVVDEEHDAAYKSDRTPRLQARDAALQLGVMAGAAVVLGSATPAVETAWHARQGTYRRFELPARPTGTLPVVDVVDLRAELRAGNRGLLSARLGDALAALEPAAREQAILVINRRGTASVVLCRDCGHVQACPDCERSLVYHHAGTSLRCHHCGRAWPAPQRCPSCDSPRIRYLGGGTERLEREVRERHPGLRVGRLDRDVVERRGAAARVVDAFASGALDVLVGTSLVTKGLDIPNVKLVGVVSADVALNLPDERAAERTYQLLVQAIGRAGRGERPGRAILQTYLPEHPAIVAAASGDPAAFLDGELELRRRFASPPFGRIVKLTVAMPDRDAARGEGEAMAARLRALAAERAAAVTVVGPAPAYIARRGDRWRWHLIVRGADPAALLGGPPDAPWTADVDPESLL